MSKLKVCISVYPACSQASHFTDQILSSVIATCSHLHLCILIKSLFLSYASLFLGAKHSWYQQLEKKLIEAETTDMFPLVCGTFL